MTYDDIECPYCEYGFDYDGDGMREDETEEFQCPSCNKYFVVSCSYSVDYHSEKADCLNGEPHVFEDVGRIPFIFYGKVGQRCNGCGRERDRDATQKEIDEETKRWPEAKDMFLPRA